MRSLSDNVRPRRSAPKHRILLLLAEFLYPDCVCHGNWVSITQERLEPNISRQSWHSRLAGGVVKLGNFG
jgi:hypothetical protein